MPAPDIDPAFGAPDDADVAHRLLGEVTGIRNETRRRLVSQSWQWASVWSLVCLGAGLTDLAGGADWYWAVATPVGLLLTLLVALRVDRRLPVQRKTWPYWAVGAAMLTLTTAVGLIFPEDVVVVWVWVVFAAGFAGLSALERQWRTVRMLGGVVALAMAGGILLPDTSVVYPVGALAVAVILADLAADSWRSRRR